MHAQSRILTIEPFFSQFHCLCLVFEKEGGRFLWALIYDKLVVLQASALSRFVERKPCRPPFVRGPLRQLFLRECSPREVDVTILVITTIEFRTIIW